MMPREIIATVAALLAAEPNAAFDTLREGGHDERYPVTIETCPRPLPPLDIEGRTVICGRVEVPENHDAPNGKTIPLAFAVLKSRSQSPAPDPVMYLHGGPGGYTVQDIPFNASVFDFLRNRRDIVIFDQRASGISDRTVACYNSFAEGIREFAKPSEDLYAEDGPLAKCVKEVTESDVDLGLYNTTQNAKDVRAIMHALGYPTYNAFGISYGTKLGQELMRAAPEGLRSLVLDSISRVDNPSYDTNGVPVDQALGAIVDLCMADTTCAEAYPDLEATVNAAGKRLMEKPLVVGGKEGDASIVNGLLEISNKTAGPFTAYMPQILTEFAKGETATADKLLAGGFKPDSKPGALTAPYAATLDAHDKAIAEVVAMQATQLQSLQSSVGRLLAALADDRSPTGQAETEQLLDHTLSEIAKGMETDERLAMAQNYVRFIGQQPDPDAIEAFVRLFVPETSLPQVLGIVAAMSDADVAAFYKRAEIDAARITSGTRMMFSLGIIACQEDFPFNSREGYDAAAKDYRFPLVDVAARADTAPLYGFCELFAHHPREGYHDPVSSEIPVLALAGMKDTQTNPSAAKMVVRTLKNGQDFTFPEAGHAVIQFSQCARDIAIAFIENPMAEVNGACIEALKPKFYIPKK